MFDIFGVASSKLIDSGRSDLVLTFDKIQKLKFDCEFNGEIVQSSPSQICNTWKHASLICYKIGQVLISRASIVELIDFTRKLVEDTYKK